MKAADLKPNTVYKVKTPGYLHRVRHYVLTGPEIKAELLGGNIYDPSGAGRWSSEPKMKDRILIKPVVWQDGYPGEWIAGNMHITNPHGIREGEWGQIQLRTILEEASEDQEIQGRQNEVDLDSAPELVEKAIEFYLEHQDGCGNVEDARVLRAYGSDLVRSGYYRRKYGY